ncbi:MAG TPA: DUF4253 domain-containing protein [Gemmataceae bacterium]|nr:DUF4253 domain-containing protein [Gemmataceae bacterium]
MKAVQDLGPPLTQAGYRVFWSVVYHADGRKKSDELAVLRTIDRYEIVRLRQTNGANYGQSNADIVSRLEQWEALCEFEIIGAAIDWVAMEFVSLPRHICSFAEEVYTFCPDSVEQGVGLMRERDHPEAFAAARQLCPKLSAAMEMRLAQQKQRFEAMTPRMPPQLLAMLRSSEAISTPTDTGIRLLAYEINKNRSLFLWWD